MLTTLPAVLGALARGQDLSADEMAGAMGLVMTGAATAAQIGALLMGLRIKGETDDEILGAAMALRSHSVQVDHGLPRVLDTCGTGGDGAHTFNVSTASAFVCAGAGVVVAKHGNRAISSRSGSADVLEALGLTLEGDPTRAAALLRDSGFAFLFAPAYHPALRHAAAPRRELGVRTLMNLLGPLANPASATHQLVGVYDASRVETVARVLGRLGVHRAIVVHGEGGLDEVSPAGQTVFAEYRDGVVRTGRTTPEEAGVPRCSLGDIAGGDAAENARLLLAVLEGRTGPYRDVTLLNAGWALFAAEAAPSPAEGVQLAVASIDSGRAFAALQRAKDPR